MERERNIMSMTTLFCYGTLKRGYWNHEIYCSEAISIEAATVRGKLYGLPSGIPVLEVPDEDILAVGTNDPLADARTQALVTIPPSISEPNGWGVIHGEIMVFEKPCVDMPPIDRLEGFSPGQVSLYRRVLVPVITSSGNVILAWCYVASSLNRNEKPTGKCVWP
jgi:gamma-glutamylcyclotransferase (GGCT)/AIG2-like uncharacterized protein YtfP